MLIQLIYISTPTSDMSEALSNFIPLAKVRNDQCRITGLIISDKSAYVQVIEGEKDQIDILFSEIKRDSRHENIKLIHYIEIQDRQFGSWGMHHVPASASKELLTLSSADLIIALFRSADYALSRNLTSIILTTIASCLLIFSILLFGAPTLEEKYFPPIAGLQATIIEETPADKTLLIVGLRDRSRNCSNDIITVESILDTQKIQGGVKVLDMSSDQQERFVAKILVTPLANKYIVTVKSKCHVLWSTPQQVLIQ